MIHYYCPPVFSNAFEHIRDDWAHVNLDSSPSFVSPHPFSQISLFDHSHSFIEPSETALNPAPSNDEYVKQNQRNSTRVTSPVQEDINYPAQAAIIGHASMLLAAVDASSNVQVDSNQPSDPTMSQAVVPVKPPKKNPKKRKRKQTVSSETCSGYVPGPGVDSCAFTPIRIRTGLPGNTAMIVDTQAQHLAVNCRPSLRRDSALSDMDLTTGLYPTKVHITNARASIKKHSVVSFDTAVAHHHVTGGLQTSYGRNIRPLHLLNSRASFYSDSDAPQSSEVHFMHDFANNQRPLDSSLNQTSRQSDTAYHPNAIGANPSTILGTNQDTFYDASTLIAGANGLTPTENPYNCTRKNTDTNSSNHSVNMPASSPYLDETQSTHVDPQMVTCTSPSRLELRTTQDTNQKAFSIQGEEKSIEQSALSPILRPSQLQFSVLQHPNISADISTSLCPISNHESLLPNCSQMQELSHGACPQDLQRLCTQALDNQTSNNRKGVRKRGQKPRKRDGERKFVCTQCRESFKRGEHLKRHMRIHTGEKPFVCPDPSCMKQFSRTDNLAQHMKVHAKPLNTPYKRRGSGSISCTSPPATALPSPPIRKDSVSSLSTVSSITTSKTAANKPLGSLTSGSPQHPGSTLRWVPVYQDISGHLVAGLPQIRPSTLSPQLDSTTPAVNSGHPVCRYDQSQGPGAPFGSIGSGMDHYSDPVYDTFQDNERLITSAGTDRNNANCTSTNALPLPYEMPDSVHLGTHPVSPQTSVNRNVDASSTTKSPLMYTSADTTQMHKSPDYMLPPTSTRHGESNPHAWYEASRPCAPHYAPGWDPVLDDIQLPSSQRCRPMPQSRSEYSIPPIQQLECNQFHPPPRILSNTNLAHYPVLHHKYYAPRTPVRRSTDYHPPVPYYHPDWHTHTCCHPHMDHQVTYMHGNNPAPQHFSPIYGTHNQRHSLYYYNHNSPHVDNYAPMHTNSGSYYPQQFHCHPDMSAYHNDEHPQYVSMGWNSLQYQSRGTN